MILLEINKGDANFSLKIMKNYYEILEVDINASKEMIERAFKLLAKRYHPDTKEESKKTWAEEKFKEINQAYEILSTAEKRKEYDIELNNKKNMELYTLSLQKEKLETRVIELELQLESIQSQEEIAGINQNINPYTNPNLYQRNYTQQPSQNEVYYTYSTPIKNRWKDLLAFTIAIFLLFFIAFLLWKIPFTKNFLIHLYEDNPPIKSIADFFIHLFE